MIDSIIEPVDIAVEVGTVEMLSETVEIGVDSIREVAGAVRILREAVEIVVDPIVELLDISVEVGAVEML